MSRIGKKVRVIPAGVTAELTNNELVITGPKGTLRLALHPHVTVVIKGTELAVTVAAPESKRDRALWGTFSSLVENMLAGVTNGFKKQLEISGVGYKALLKGVDLHLEVGFTHPVIIKAVPGVSFAVEKNIIMVSGIDKQAVGEMAAVIRSTKKPEPYKGKGIKYIDEVIRRKAGKTAAKAAA